MSTPSAADRCGRLLELVRSWEPLDEEWPEVADPPPQERRDLF